MRALIVDDSSGVRERLAALVRGLEVETRDVGSAAEALTCVASFRPDLVVLDLHMPGGSGLELLLRITACAAPPVVIVWTNEASDQHRRWCLSHGASFFFDKSTDQQQLLAAILETAAACAQTIPPGGES